MTFAAPRTRTNRPPNSSFSRAVHPFAHGAFFVALALGRTKLARELERTDDAATRPDPLRGVDDGHVSQTAAVLVDFLGVISGIH